jgi:hypothetical protein
MRHSVRKISWTKKLQELFAKNLSQKQPWFSLSTKMASSKKPTKTCARKFAEIISTQTPQESPSLRRNNKSSPICCLKRQKQPTSKYHRQTPSKRINFNNRKCQQLFKRKRPLRMLQRASHLPLLPRSRIIFSCSRWWLLVARRDNVGRWRLILLESKSLIWIIRIWERGKIMGVIVGVDWKIKWTWVRKKIRTLKSWLDLKLRLRVTSAEKDCNKS